MKVLIVEDAVELRETLFDCFKEEGYTVDTASDGDEALYRIIENDYGAVVLDVSLPARNGFEILEEVRKTKQTPVILLTARGDLKDRVHGLDLGADDYLTKPFELAELMARVRAISRRGQGERAPTIAVGEVTLDIVRREAFRNGVLVELTSREYLLLETLMLRCGEVVSRDRLYDNLYSEDEMTLSNILDVYISRLRTKFGKKFITTRRGFGYIVEKENDL